MHATFEIDIVQNEVLGAELLWQAIAECCAQSAGMKGIPLPGCFLVLPIALHRRSTVALASKVGAGAFQRALAETRDFSVGLQRRMQAMSSRTFASLNLGLAAGLFALEQSRLQLFSTRRSPPAKHSTEAVRQSMSAAKRLGQAAAELDLPQIATLLEVTF
jgi:hypothetical protein